FSRPEDALRLPSFPTRRSSDLRPGWDTLTRLNWSELPPNPAGQSAPASPSLQAVGAAALVPFRNPAPAFSRDILISRDFGGIPIDRKSTRLNSSHVKISYAVFC